MERFGARLSSWWMIAIPCSRALFVSAKVTGSPSSTIVPEVGCSTPERIFIKVDFPAPFSPNRVVTDPRWTEKFTPLRRSEERRVGKEGRDGGEAHEERNKQRAA